MIEMVAVMIVNNCIETDTKICSSQFAMMMMMMIVMAMMIMSTTKMMFMM